MINKRLEREKNTIEKMIKIYCKNNHKEYEKLCDKCDELLEYALNRVENCKFRENKPICVKCSIHCYKKEMQESIKKVMRYSGPRMLFYHPILTIKHLINYKK